MYRFCIFSCVNLLKKDSLLVKFVSNINFSQNIGTKKVKNCIQLIFLTSEKKSARFFICLRS
jgi:hypothetical protein